MTALLDTVPERDGLCSSVSEENYHADRGSLSFSGAKLLLPPSCPAKFRERRDNPPKPKREFDFGHLAHRILLRKGADIAVLNPAVHGLKRDGTVADSPRATATWKDAEAKARARGATPVHIDDARAAVRMVREVRAHPEAGPLFERGHAEVALYHTDPLTGVRLRARTDWMTTRDDRLTIVDYKTAANANRDIWMRKAYDLGYHIQFAWYVTLVKRIKWSDNPAFLFVVQEKTPPYPVSVIEMDADAYRLGCKRMNEAIEIYRQCTATDTWPGYGDGIQTGSLPPWAFNDDAPTIQDLIDEYDED